MNISILSLLLITMSNAYIRKPSFRNNFKQKILRESSEELWDHGEVLWEQTIESSSNLTSINTNTSIHKLNDIDAHTLAMLCI